MNIDLIQSFLGKTVQVKVEGFTIYGKLCSFFDSGESCLLLLWSKKIGFTLVSGNFDSLGETEHV
jgi:hypothetical protein